MRVINRQRDRRLGERHFRADTSDHFVELARRLHEDHHLGYGTIAAKLEVSRYTVRDWCTYRRRG